MSRRNRIALVLCLPAAACFGTLTSHADALKADVDLLKHDRQTVSAQLDRERRQLDSLTERREQTDDDLAQLHEGVRAYIMDHKMAIVCMGAAGVALADSNRFAQDVQQVGTAMAVLCGLGALADSAFVAEVTTVADQLVQAGSRGDGLAEQLRRLDDKRTRKRAAVTADSSRVARITSQVDSLQHELQALGRW